MTAGTGRSCVRVTSRRGLISTGPELSTFSIISQLNNIYTICLSKLVRDQSDLIL